MKTKKRDHAVAILHGDAFADLEGNERDVRDYPDGTFPGSLSWHPVKKSMIEAARQRLWAKENELRDEVQELEEELRVIDEQIRSLDPPEPTQSARELIEELDVLVEALRVEAASRGYSARGDVLSDQVKRVARKLSLATRRGVPKS